MKYGMFFFVCIAFLVATGLMTGSAVAENGCPNGYEPWKIPVESSSDCMAIPDYGNDRVEKSQVPIWETNWGAVAIGDGGWGVAVNMRSKAKAKKAAVSQCRKTAGNKSAECAVLTYYNQCVAIAWGLTGYAVQSAENQETASSIAMRQCKDKGHEDCKIFYSACSLPRQIN